MHPHPRFGDEGALWTGHGQELRGIVDRSQLERPVTHVLEHRLVRQRASGKRIQIAGELLGCEFPGVMLEEAGNPPIVQEGGDRVEVSEVDDDGPVGGTNDRIVEGAKDRGRSGVHHKDRDTAGPGAGHRAHPRHAFRDFVAEKAKPFQAGPPRDLLP